MVAKNSFLFRSGGGCCGDAVAAVVVALKYLASCQAVDTKTIYLNQKQISLLRLIFNRLLWFKSLFC